MRLEENAYVHADGDIEAAARQSRGMDISKRPTDAGDSGYGGNRLAAVATDDTRSGTSPGLDTTLRSARATTAWQAEGKAMVAEFIGTFTLIFAGVGAIAVTAPLGAASLVPVALAH